MSGSGGGVRFGVVEGSGGTRAGAETTAAVADEIAAPCLIASSPAT
jgi:hypothetical protein